MTTTTNGNASPADAHKTVTVYVDMVADLFHYGHVNYLRQCRALGDRLVVGITSDEVVMTYKRRPIMTTEERARSVEGCRYADLVIAGAPAPITRDFIDEHGIDIVAHGDDFSEEDAKYWYKVPYDMGIFQTVPYTHGISTSELIRRVQDAPAPVKRGNTPTVEAAAASASQS